MNSIVVNTVIAAATIAMFLAITGLMYVYAGRSRWRGFRSRAALLSVLVVWTVGAISIAWVSALQWLALAVALPIIAATVWALTPQGRIFLSVTPVHWLVAIQLYRVVGGLFLYAYYSDGRVSEPFALSAGWGDIATGLLAVPVAWMLWKRMRGSGWAFLAWTILGVVDLIVAPIMAFAYGATALVAFPMSVIPMWLGPPLGNVLHILAAKAFFLQRRRSLEKGSPSVPSHATRTTNQPAASSAP
ncbi:MAG: hypothetical protein AAFX44_19940 [Pseudomonadota bacterium]